MDFEIENELLPVVIGASLGLVYLLVVYFKKYIQKHPRCKDCGTWFALQLKTTKELGFKETTKVESFYQETGEFEVKQTKYKTIIRPKKRRESRIVPAIEYTYEHTYCCKKCGKTSRQITKQIY
jgi:hypothetical protein